MQTEKNSTLNYLKVAGENAKTAIIMIHGYGASMHDLYGLSEVIETPFACDWYFPDGHVAVPLGFMMEGRAWFPIDMAELEKHMMSGTFRSFADKCPQEFLDALAKMETFVLNVTKEYDHVILGGFSQGAMLATHVGSRLKKVDALMLFSGTLIANEILDNALAKSKAKPFIQSHGKSDPLLNYADAKKLFELLKLHGFNGEFVPFQGAHEIPMPVIAKVNDFIKELKY
jgi:phospholipase/carboxylesterase